MKIFLSLLISGIATTALYYYFEEDLKKTLRAGTVALLFISAIIGLAEGQISFAVVGLAGLAVISSWEFIKDRSLSIGTEGIKLGEPSTTSSQPGDKGDVRDNFISLGNYFMFRGQPDYMTAYQHFFAADRLGSSLLTAFRCMQCIALAQHPDNNTLLAWFDKAIEHVDGPWEKLRGRQNFAQWIRDRRTNRHTPNFLENLRHALTEVQF